MMFLELLVSLESLQKEGQKEPGKYPKKQKRALSEQKIEMMRPQANIAETFIK
jgi:hypothetical protein